MVGMVRSRDGEKIMSDLKEVAGNVRTVCEVKKNGMAGSESFFCACGQPRRSSARCTTQVVMCQECQEITF